MKVRPQSFSLWASLGIVLWALPANSSTFQYPDFSSAAGVRLLGTATQSADILRLTDADPRGHEVAAAWYDTQLMIANGFDAVFGFRISHPGGAPDFSGHHGGDGFAFVVQGVGTNAIGIGEGGIGYYGIARSLAVEFDTWQNAHWYFDPNGNHISVNSLGIADNRPEHNLASLGQTTMIPNLKDGQIHIAEISYVPGSLSVFIDDLTRPVLTVPVDLVGSLGLTGGNAWLGFTASTGGAFEQQEILNWSVTVNSALQTMLTQNTDPHQHNPGPSAVPEPPALLLVGAGSVLIALSRTRGRVRAAFRREPSNQSAVPQAA